MKSTGPVASIAGHGERERESLANLYIAEEEEEEEEEEGGMKWEVAFVATAGGRYTACWPLELIQSVGDFQSKRTAVC
jgi:hypothetical protein